MPRELRIIITSVEYFAESYDVYGVLTDGDRVKAVSNRIPGPYIDVEYKAGESTGDIKLKGEHMPEALGLFLTQIRDAVLMAMTTEVTEAPSESVAPSPEDVTDQVGRIQPEINDPDLNPPDPFNPPAPYKADDQNRETD